MKFLVKEGISNQREKRTATCCGTWECRWQDAEKFVVLFPRRAVAVTPYPARRTTRQSPKLVGGREVAKKKARKKVAKKAVAKKKAPKKKAAKKAAKKKVAKKAKK